MTAPDPYLAALDGALGDELEAIERAREADGQPWWADRFGDLTAPWPDDRNV